MISEETLKDIINTTVKLKYKEEMVVDLSFVDKKTIRDLNRDYRDIDKATDVLSFCMKEGEFAEFSDNLLGDVIVCEEVVRENAKKNNINFDEEYIRVIIHGILHLLGHDHAEKDEKKVMFDMQEKLVKKFLEIKE